MPEEERIQKTLSSLVGVLNDFRSYALDTDDTGTKQMFRNYAQQLENMTQGLKGRVNDLERSDK